MKWVITEDLLEPDSSDVGRNSGDMGLKARRVSDPKERRQVVDFLVRIKGDALPYEFELRDGDDEPYYRGFCGDITQASEQQAFAPLDWARYHAGCVSMFYRKRGQQDWKEL